MNLDNTKTKRKDISLDIDEITTSLTDSILSMKYLSRDEIAILIKTRLDIFYSKQHVAKLTSKIANLENNMLVIKHKAKSHNLKCSLEANFWKEKYEELTSYKEVVKKYDELNILRSQLETKILEEEIKAKY